MTQSLKDKLVILLLAALGTAFMVTFIAIEEQTEIFALLLVAAALIVAAAKFGVIKAISQCLSRNEKLMNGAVIAAVLVVVFWFREDHFPLLMIATVMMYVIACFGLNMQFGYTGVVNFAGAAFFGIGCYTAAVLGDTSVPLLMVIALGGIAAAIIGSILIIPVLRTRGHYAAVVTIAFGLLFRTFLEVNDTLGGPQGLRVPGMNLFGWDFNSNIEISENIELSFYMNYVILALIMVILAFVLMRRIERSWIGLNFDAVRLDETAAACFGIDIKRWKITAFTLGNFLAGTAGALYAMMLGFIAPSNFAFSDSLILVSIVLLGGMGSLWGTILAAGLVVLLPEKLQAIQEYRFLIYAIVMILILLFRPQGILPRGLRAYIPGWRG
ncbi:branched-chain amino acid ABC transporter permease [Thalassospira alkalitolerans]|uniref:ABC transporter permease n=1 Tax=Thalassospira alkalitolerans TaxID=1293890 RepID=A0A1Y2LD50_9PROT|nr:branched-chain amino acid ABC transporter permease [Thalassospira alkalitolerans]OSQ47498.1 ABC transporter permease [Thalassospira alkalitolerans]|tara:strand:+ start:22734 stop:23885 length:1152 start_codon:yes stop_codon:yes gene_type:complete